MLLLFTNVPFPICNLMIPLGEIASLLYSKVHDMHAVLVYKQHTSCFTWQRIYPIISSPWP